MTKTLGEALPEGIAKVSELIGRMEREADEYDAMSPGMGAGVRMTLGIIKVHRDVALAAQQSGDVIAMLSAFQKLKPAIELADADAEAAE